MGFYIGLKFSRKTELDTTLCSLLREGVALRASVVRDTPFDSATCGSFAPFFFAAAGTGPVVKDQTMIYDLTASWRTCCNRLNGVKIGDRLEDVESLERDRRKPLSPRRRLQ